MTLVAVRPNALQPGDPVIIDQAQWIVRAIEGPDHNETYDLYLMNDLGNCHKVIRDEPIHLINE
jgi:hypothetical protein